MTGIDGRRVVVTGKIAGETRSSVEVKLRLAGAIVQSSVTTDTDVLVTGEAVGATKMKAAAAKGVEIVPWEQAKRLLAGGNGNGSAAKASGPASTPAARSLRPGAFSPMLAKACEDGLPAGDG